MASVEEALATWLEADPVVAAAVVDENGNPRVFPTAPPLGSDAPNISYRTISSVGSYHLGGASGLRTARVRLTVNSGRFGDVVAVREAVRQLDGFSGTLSGLRVYRIAFEDHGDDYDADDGSEEGIYEREFDLMIKYRESVPS